LRFNELPASVVEKLNQLDDVVRLKQLHLQSVTSQSLEEFQRSLADDN